jgi:zinc protease
MAEGRYLTRLPTHERRLENGLTVLVREDHSAPVVAIVTHVKAGYFNEPDRLVGISHVLEHMYFKGTERRGVGDLARETKAAGGYLNAGTIYDYTSYYTVLPSSALELGLDIQSDALLNSKIDEEELRRELEVIIEEARRKLDNPGAVAAESLYEEMFEVHRMRRWRIGTEEGLRRLTRADVWEYYRNLYRPSNIVLVIAGDVDPERTFELVERYYGGMPAGEVVRDRSPEEPERRGFRFREQCGDIVQTQMEWGWRTPGTLDPDTPVLDLLAAVLGQGRASRLYGGVREAGWVSAIGAGNYTPTELGVFRVSAELAPADTRGALEAIWREVEAVRREGIAPAELERAKSLLEAGLLARLETVQGQANLLAEWQALGHWRLAEQYMDRLLSATPGDVQRVAREYLALDRATVLVYRPQGAEALGWTAEEVEAMLREAAAAGARVAVPGWVEEAGVGKGGRLDAAYQEAGYEDGVHFYELSNGVRVAIKPRRRSALVSMAICGLGGAVDETEETAGLTSLMAQASVKGTKTRSAARLAVEMEALGGAISPVVSSDLFYWIATVPSRHFEQALSLVADAALGAVFPEKEVERERSVALRRLARLRDDMYRYPLSLFLQGAFPGHPYGFSLGAREEALRRHTRADVELWHRGQVLEARPWVLVVGDVDPGAAAAAIARALEPVSGTGSARRPPAPVWPAGPRVVAEHRAKAQTALVLGFPGPARNDPDIYALQVLSAAVSGLGGRIFEELRGRRSLAYSVAVYPLAYQLAGALVASIATSPEKEDEARRGLLEELERLAEESLPREEVERAQNYLVGDWKIRGQTNTAQLSELAGALLLGNGLVDLREFEARIRAVTPIQIREVVQRWLDRDRLVEGIVRGTGSGR